MKERPWWVYALQIVLLASVTGALVIIVSDLNQHHFEFRPPSHIFYLTFAMMGIGIFCTVVALLRWLRDKHVGFWDLFSGWF